MPDITITQLDPDLEKRIADAQAATAAQHAAAQLPALLAERAERERVATAAAQGRPLQRQVDDLLPGYRQAALNRDAAIMRLFKAWSEAINAARTVGEMAYQVDRAAEALALHQLTAESAYPPPPVQSPHWQNGPGNLKWAHDKADLEATRKARILREAGLQLGSENTFNLVADQGFGQDLASLLVEWTGTYDGRGGGKPRIGLTITY